MLDDGPDRTEVLDSLRALPDTDLLIAGPDALMSMETFQLAAQSKVSSPQATSPKAREIASKLCARKRPQPFDVRNREVCGYLRLTSSGGHRPLANCLSRLFPRPSRVRYLRCMERELLFRRDRRAS